MKRFKHNLSYYNLATLNMGELVPIGLTEVLPGDTIQHHTNVVIRVSPLAAPVMHSVTARVHHFYVPHRLVWDGWEDFITGGPDGDNSDTVPQFIIDNWEVTPLLDYLGVPNPESGIGGISELPIRGFNLIYNEWYRDQDLVPPRGENNATIPKIAWEKDYFTTARPWTQKGPDISLPLAGQADCLVPGVNAGTDNQNVSVADNNQELIVGNSSGLIGNKVVADLGTAEFINVNDFRKAFALQRYQEARARYGSRYTEYLRFLGVRPRDERLQRPEFLGGGNAQLQFSEVMQTAPDAQGDPRFGVADMYGHGIAAMRSNKYRRHMEEHGYVFTLLSVRPKAVYSNGIDRTWMRRDKEDFFQKELQYIGQQEVWNDEVYFGAGQGRQTFGYQDRYSDYRRGFNRVTGEYRDILNYWHMAREFESMPTLNRSFIECDATKRIHNEQSQHALWVMAQHKIGARRLVNRSAEPKIL